MSLVVVIVARKYSVRIDIAIRSHKSSGFASTLDAHGVVCLETGGVEVLK